MVDFFLYLLDAIEIDGTLTFRHVQRLVRRILEETVVGNAFGKRGSTNQVGVEQQSHHIVIQARDGGGSHRLHGSEARYSAVAVVIFFVTVGQQAAARILQVKGINAVVPCHLVVD